MTRNILLLVIGMCTASLPAFSQQPPQRIAIIKADDVRGITPKWTRFFEISREKGVKVSAGIICSSLEGAKGGYVGWLQKLQGSGTVEFWNHGWDHKRWETETGKQLKEFNGSGYAHQKKHFEDAQNLMREVLGVAPVAFGAPYNAMDADTARVMKENSDMRLFFGYNAKGGTSKILAPMKLRGESNGTSKPNFEAFKAEYEKKDISFTAIQFHPNGFGEKQLAEYTRILDFLIAEGWTFMLPAEYVAMLDQAAAGE